jgi:hypothetical protein
MSELRNASIHEAGHLIVGHTLGSMLIDARVARDGGGEARIFHRAVAPRSQIMVCMAGSEAERLFHADPSDDHIDRERMQELAAQHGVDDAELRELRRLTVEILTDRRDAVRPVAVALRSRRYLDGDAIVRRIRFARPRFHFEEDEGVTKEALESRISECLSDAKAAASVAALARTVVLEIVPADREVEQQQQRL